MESNIISLDNSLAVIKDHEGNPLQLSLEGEELWASAKDWGELLEYDSPADSLIHLYGAHQKELDRAGVTRLQVVKVKGKPPIRIREFNIQGFAYLCMFSDQPKAEDVRTWATAVMKELWVRGHKGSSIIQITKEDFADLINQFSQNHQKTEIEIRQEVHEKDITAWNNILTQNPERLFFLTDHIRDHVRDYRATYHQPHIGVTRVNPDLFAELWMDRRVSPDYILEMFPLDFKTLADVEAYRKKVGLPKRTIRPIEKPVAKQMFRDRYLYRMDSRMLVRAYSLYSRDSILKNIKNVETGIMRTFAQYRVPGVERDKPSYDGYINSDPWKVHKKGAIVFPDGPLDHCWDCNRHLSMSTADLHHLTYQRLGEELYEDVIPLCRTCHIYRHPEKNGLPPDIKNPNEVVRIPFARILEWWNDKRKSYRVEINGRETWVAPYAIHPSSPTRNIGQEGPLVVIKARAENVLPLLNT